MWSGSTRERRRFRHEFDSCTLQLKYASRFAGEGFRFLGWGGVSRLGFSAYRLKFIVLAVPVARAVECDCDSIKAPVAAVP